MTVLFTVWGYDVTAIELASVVLAFLAIGLGIRGTRWTWPFYFLSSLLYGWLFVQFDLFASAAMQLIFMAAAVWGWFSWAVRAFERRVGSHRWPGSADSSQRPPCGFWWCHCWRAWAAQPPGEMPSCWWGHWPGSY